MDAKELKEYIVDNDKSFFILESLDCQHIKYHSSNSGYWTFGNPPPSDNPTAVTLYKDLGVINYTKELPKPSDIFTLIEYYKELSFFQSLKWVHELLGLDLYQKQKSNLPESLRITKMLLEMKNSDMCIDDQEPIKPLSEAVLDYYRPYVNDLFLRDGISYETQKEFLIGYDEQTNYITIPVFDEHSILTGVKGRIFKEKDQISSCDLKYYYLEPMPKSKVLYGYYKTEPYIKKSSEIYIVEAEKGVLQLWSYGYRNCVSTGGTKISKTQIEHITRLGKKIVFAFDKDVDENELNGIAEKFLENIPIYAIIDKENILEEKESPSDNNKKWQYLLKNNVYQIR